jgi:hypothetical protein
VENHFDRHGLRHAGRRHQIIGILFEENRPTGSVDQNGLLRECLERLGQRTARPEEGNDTKQSDGEPGRRRKEPLEQEHGHARTR